MKKVIPVILAMFLVASCNGWVLQPGPFNPPTPFLPPTNTPSILTATPVVIGASPTPTVQFSTATSLPFITATSVPTYPPPASDTPVSIQTTLPSGPAVSVEVL